MSKSVQSPPSSSTLSSPVLKPQMPHWQMSQQKRRYPCQAAISGANNKTVATSRSQFASTTTTTTLQPTTAAANFGNCRILLRKQLQIYTDWANHYLQKRYDELDAHQRDPSMGGARSEFHEPSYQSPRRKIQSLSSDLNDGVLLLYIVESVADTSMDSTTANIFRAPRTTEQMLTNISVAVQFLHSLGVNVADIQPKDIHEGNLKTILTLFFNISRFKQTLKTSNSSHSGSHCHSPALQAFSPSGYCSDPGIIPQSRLLAGRRVGSTLGPIAPSPASSASSITSLLSTTSLPVNSNSSQLATHAAPSVEMISKLPSSSSHQIGGYSRLTQPPPPPSRGLVTSGSIPQHLTANNIHNNSQNGTLKRPTTAPNAAPTRASSHSVNSVVSPQESSSTPSSSHGLRTPAHAGSRLSSSIGGPRTNRPPSTISGSSSTTSTLSNSSKLQPSTSKSKSLALGGLRTPTASSSKISPTSSGSDTSPTSSQSSSTKSKISSASSSKLGTPKNGTLKYSGQLTSLKASSGQSGSTTKLGSISSQRRSSSSKPNSRPTSTIVENGSMLPTNNSPKPTAAVKGVVTGSNRSQSLARVSPADKKIKKTDSSKPEPPAPIAKEEDSTSSNGSDIEAALAQLEPMAPIQRPTNYGFLKNGCGAHTLPVRKTIDDTDNSESFDDTTSSLSTDPSAGLLSPSADISPSTPTTTSSLCSSLSENHRHSGQRYPPGPPSSSGKSSGGSCQSEPKSATSGTTNSSGIGSSRKSSIESSNGDLTLMPESQSKSRPLSSPSSKILFGQKPLPAKPTSLATKSTLRPKFVRPEMTSTHTEVYSDSECMQRSNFMRTNPPIRENLYSNTLELYGTNRPVTVQYDTDSDMEFGHGNYASFVPLVQQQHQQHQQQPQQQYPAMAPMSKPGNLIYEYETMNRAYRETMSASPTYLTKEQASLPVRRQYPNIFDVTRPPSGSMKSSQQQQPPTSSHHQDLNGSSLSLLSSASSSIFATPEEKLAHESRRMRRELEQAHEKIYTLSSQLGANAHMVAAFEQSLSSMTNRLQELSSNSDLKDCELDRLRRTIEALKHHGGALVQGVERNQRSSSIGGPTPNTPPTNEKLALSQRQPSNESVNSISSDKGSKGGKNSKSKFKSLTSQNANWIRSSFSKVLKKKPKGETDGTMLSDGEEINGGSMPGSPLPSVKSFKTATSASNASEASKQTMPDSVDELQRVLREKDMALTDMRLDTLSSAHQLESMKESLGSMRLEMVSLKQDNERLQRLVKHKSLTGSSSSLIQSVSQNFFSKTDDELDDDDEYDSDEPTILTLEGSLERGSAIRPVTIGSGTHTLATFGLPTKTTWFELDRLIQRLFREHLIRVDKHLSLGITVDSLACYRVGAEQIQRDLTLGAGLSENTAPEMLPFAYLVSESHINLQFKCTLDSLTFDTLTPKSILNHYIDILNRERRLLLGGASGTGKTHIAHKLAEYLVIQEKLTGNELYGQSISGAIATFAIDHKNTKELCNYLAQLLSDPETLTPMVIILDNLHHVDELLISEIHADLDRLQRERGVFTIATLNSDSSEIISRIFEEYSLMKFSVECEPVRGFLGRYLTRKWLQSESKSGRAPLVNCSRRLEKRPMTKVIRWLPRVWRFLNRYLSKFVSSHDQWIGPRLFTSCPMDFNGAQIWFADLWNFSILPFITESLRETISKTADITEQQQLFNRLKDDDPTEWIVANYPWNVTPGNVCEWTDHLNRLKIEDILESRDSCDSVLASSSQRSGSQVGKPPTGQNDKMNDPFMQMLLKLKEASTNDSERANEQ